MLEVVKFAVAELTHRNGTKSRVSSERPDPDWLGKLLADPDVIKVKLVQKASRESVRA